MKNEPKAQEALRNLADSVAWWAEDKNLRYPKLFNAVFECCHQIHDVLHWDSGAPQVVTKETRSCQDVGCSGYSVRMVEDFWWRVWGLECMEEVTDKIGFVAEFVYSQAQFSEHPVFHLIESLMGGLLVEVK